MRERFRNFNVCVAMADADRRAQVATASAVQGVGGG